MEVLKFLLIDDAKIYAKNGSMQHIVLNFLLKYVKVLLMSDKIFQFNCSDYLNSIIKMVSAMKKLQKKLIFC